MLKRHNQYRKKHQTARPKSLLLMLYNGLVKFMRALTPLKGQIEVAHINILRAQDIIQEFMITLDKEIYRGSQQLIYEYMYRRMVEANARKDAAILGEVLNLAKQLRDVWEQAMKLARRPVKAQEMEEQAK